MRNDGLLRTSASTDLGMGDRTFSFYVLQNFVSQTVERLG